MKEFHLKKGLDYDEGLRNKIFFIAKNSLQSDMNLQMDPNKKDERKKKVLTSKPLSEATVRNMQKVLSKQTQ